jgi:AAA ATPase domain
VLQFRHVKRTNNPYTPNAGAMPPALTGRDSLLADFEVLVQRVQNGLDEKGLLVTGLRGVGKTVLLNRFRETANMLGAVVVAHEASKIGAVFAVRFGTLARRALLDVSPAARWKPRAAHAAAVIKSFGLTVDPNGKLSFGIDVDPADGLADSGDLTMDVSDVVVALGEAALDHGQVVVFLFDEIQYLSSEELGAIVMAKHQVNQRRLPIVFAGAGLPQLPALAGTAQTYSERMFSFPVIGKLAAAEARMALTQPAADLGVLYEDEAVDHIVRYTDGYPFFIQEFGKAVWNLAASSPILRQDARAAERLVEATLDQDFFAVRADGLPAGELAYIRALAALGGGEHTQAEVAKQMGKKSSANIGAPVTRLIERGLVYRSRRGRVAFSVPQFDRYVTRALSL